jgi:hypothetical protein
MYPFKICKYAQIMTFNTNVVYQARIKYILFKRSVHFEERVEFIQL